MDQRKAFLFFGLMVLVWSVFWQGFIRTLAVKHVSEHGDSPAASGALVAV